MAVGWFIDDTPSKSFPIYTRGNVGEVFPDPVSPLTADHTWHGAGDVGIRDFMSRFTIDLDEIDPGNKLMFEIFGGYMYLNLSVARLMGARSSGMTPEMVDMGFFGSSSALPAYTPREKDQDPEICSRVDTLMFSWMTATDFPIIDELTEIVETIVSERPDLSAISDEALIQRMRDMMPLFARIFSIHSEVSAAASVTMGAITGLALGLGKPGLDLRIAGGLGAVASAAPSFAMWDLSRIVNSSHELTNAFDEGLEDLQTRIDSIANSEFDEGFVAFLKEFGSRGPNEWELRSQTWQTHPELVLAIIDRMRLASGDHDPRNRHSEARNRSVDALNELRNMVQADETAVGTLEIASTSSSVFIPAREQAKTIIVKVVHEVRLAALELGKRLAEVGKLEKQSHIFMLQDKDLETAIENGMSEEAASRENEYLELFDLNPPFWFAGEVPNEVEWVGETAALPNRKVIQGMGGSAGVVTGRARIILDPTNPGNLEPGDILVAPITDPSWTPLFVPASAVVVDVGATMSHAVIVSRELGIPCVVSATGATSRIPDGAEIRVNGDTGTVTILS
ncbi:MAG: PEP-utilizing enzyme [Acidimicrobiales bacterium]|nr:PEP-utilizing enzyme [Acidimicrobiales bacterium]HJM29151.1 PEP-utilizing enzyme [Acidimicrobiales bacterium]HJM97295.1 PEP-utilizing enzyme [Acidimicrobiales bacterium]